MLRGRDAWNLDAEDDKNSGDDSILGWALILSLAMLVIVIMLSNGGWKVLPIIAGFLFPLVCLWLALIFVVIYDKVREYSRKRKKSSQKARG